MNSEPTPFLYLRLLGPPLIRMGGIEQSFLEDKRYQLLAYLACKRDWVYREQLAYLFWSETDPSTARKNLRHLLGRVRALELPQLEILDERLRWMVPSDFSDFEQAIGQSRWEQAIGLYGELLAGFEGEDTPEFSDWLYTQREQVKEQWRSAVLQQTQLAAQARRTGESLRLFQTLLQHDPLDEEALEGYMNTAIQAGQRGQALRAYSSFTERLREELNLPPTLKLEHLANSIRQESPELQVLSRLIEPPLLQPSLPIPVTSFVGRDLELAEVTNYLQNPDCRLLTLTGPGGVGKSRLALQAAQEQAQRYTDGTHFVALDSLSTPEQIPMQIAETLKLPLKGSDLPLTQLIQAIGGKQMLLLLDNYEHLLGGATVVAELLEKCRNLQLLVTSRERLGLAAEWVIPVGGLGVPPEWVSLEEALSYDAVEFFVLRARQVRLDFRLDADNLAAVLKICRMVEGFPLALELAAVWMRILSVEEIAQEIASSLDFLVSQHRDGHKRHHSMRAVFEQSWKQLTPHEQQALRRLSVFYGGFRSEAAKQVTSTPLPVLAALVDKSLLRLNPLGRYDRHALLFQYMQEKLTQDPQEETATQANHSHYYLGYLQRSLETIRGPNPKKILENLEEELQNLRLAWSWAVKNQLFQPIKEASEALMRFFDARGRYQEALEMFGEALQAIDPHNPDQQAVYGTLLIWKGKFHQRLQQHQTAQQLSQEGLECLRPIGELEAMIWGLGTLGTASDEDGYYQTAHQWRTEALEMARKLSNPRLIAVCLGWLAISEETLGHYPQAIKCYREAIALFKKLNNRLGAVHNLNNLSGLLLDQGNFLEAKPLLQETLEQIQASGQITLLSDILALLSQCCFKLGELEPALAYTQQAIATLSEQEIHKKANLQAMLGQISAAMGQTAEARVHFKQALGQTWEQQQIPAALNILLRWAETLDLASPDKARMLQLILAHPRTHSFDRDHAKKLLEQLDTSPSASNLPSLEEAVEHLLYG